MDEGSEARYECIVTPYLAVRMRDGIELAVQIHRPNSAGGFPVLLSYCPYRVLSRRVSGRRRVSDQVGDPNPIAPGDPRDYPAYFAEHGYVVVDFDMRGTGNSGGSSTEQYSADELQDGYDMIEWCARQPWSNGNVGMWGISYGGVDTFQMAAAAPPHLKAVIIRSGTDDVYTDWAYPGGVPRPLYLHGIYGANITAQNFAPPDIELVGTKWEEIWQTHLEGNVPWPISWMQHQLDGKYWRDRSVRPDYGRIKCAVFVIAGWYDWYAMAELRAYERLSVPKRALVGPWGHYWPELALPGPRLDCREEYLRWWDHWLKGVENGIMNEPPVTVYICEHQPPAPMYNEVKGFWRQEREWPPARTQYHSMYLDSDARLQADPSHAPDQPSQSYEYVPSVGGRGSLYGLGGTEPWGLPLDQRADEASSLIYTSAPLDSDLEVTGTPEAELYVSSSATVAWFEVKLCDVSPDGTSKLVSSGGLNATHHSSHSEPELLTPNKVYHLAFPLETLAYIFPKGHCIRVDVSSADFPNAWPVSQKATNTVYQSSGAWCIFFGAG